MSLNLFDSANYPKVEPECFTVGERIAWKKTEIHAVYDSSLYTLTYSCRREGGGTDVISLAATVTSNEFLIEIPIATSDDYVAGRYHWQSFITRISDNERIKYQSGSFEILPDLIDSSADTRSHAKIVLDNIEAVIEGRATSEVLSYSIAGRTLSKIPTDQLSALRDKYLREYSREVKAERISRGLSAGGRVKIRFG